MLNKKLIQAANFAAEKHKSQRRKDADKTPYINHPLALAHVLAVAGDVDDVDVICGALLHVTVEDTETTEAELLAGFGASITRIFLELTDDKNF